MADQPPAGYKEVPAPSSQPPKGYTEVPAPAQPQPIQQSTPQPNPDAIPLTVDQNPQSYIQTGPATPSNEPARERGITREGVTGGKDWLLDALTAPGTFLGRMFQPFHEPSKEAKYMEHVSGQPAIGNLPLIDPSIGMEPGFAKGVIQGAGGITAPNQLPLALFSPESKAVSGLFAAMTVPQLTTKAAQYTQLKAQGKDAEASQVLGEMATIGAMGTLATYHAAGGGERLSTLDKDEQAYLKSVLEDHYKSEIKQEVEGGKPQLQQVSPGTPQPEGVTPTGPVDNTRSQAPAPDAASLSREEAIRNDTGTTGREGATPADTIERTEQERATREAAERGTRAEPVDEMERRLRGVPVTEDNIAQITAILPEFNKVVGGVEGEGARPLTRETPATGAADNEPPPPVISRAIDDDMMGGGISVQHRGEDVNGGARALGSFIESVRQLRRDGHPLGEVLYKFTSLGSDAIKAMATNSMDTLKTFINGSYKLVNDNEWRQVADTLNLPADDPAKQVAIDSLNPKMRQAFDTAADILENGRIKLRDAKRWELRAMKPKLAWDSPDPDAPSITKFYPDNWGKPGGYYPNAHPGSWAITQMTGVDERGTPIWEPIDSENTSWRALSEFQAKDVAEKWRSEHPGVTLRVRQDTISAGANSLTDRTRLQRMVAFVREASTTVIDGGADPKEAFDQLYNQAAASAYGPRRAAKRQFGAVMQREANLQGYSRDIDDFRDHLMATERYAVLAPARQKMMAIRNQIAELAGARQVQSPSDLPTFKFPAQYANILGRTDSFIEGLEGTPGLSDAIVKYTLNGLGLDPALANKVMSPIQQLWATLKLGLNPVRIFSHGLQSIWAVNTVIGEKATIDGYAHSFDPKYDWLIHDLAIKHAGNMSDLEGFRDYAGAYFGRGNTPIDWAKGSLQIMRDIGISPLTMGIEFSSRTAAIGAYIQGIERGMDALQARNYARDILDRTMGVYHAADNPPLLRQLPSTVAQFKGFMAKTGQFILGLRGAEIPRFLAAAALLGGVTGAGISQLSGLVHLATGGESIEDYVKRKYPHLARGVFGLAGVDVPSAVGPGDFSPWRSNAPLGGVLGPLWSDIVGTAKATQERIADPVSQKAKDDFDAAMRGLSPQGRRIWDEAIRGTSTNPSLIDPRTGSTIIKQLSPLERIEAVVGFTPLKVAEERTTHEYIRNQLLEAKDHRAFFVDKLAENQLELMRPNLTSEQKADLVKEAANLQKLAIEYNQAHNLIPAVRDRIKGMMQDRLERDIKKAPKAERPMIQQEMQRYQQEQQ